MLLLLAPFGVLYREHLLHDPCHHDGLKFVPKRDKAAKKSEALPHAIPISDMASTCAHADRIDGTAKPAPGNPEA
jgi:hypothetical protein